MKIEKLKMSIGEAKDIENVIATKEKLDAIMDYNFMMGNLDDPNEEDEEDE